MIGQEGRELQRRLLQATFDIDGAREERAAAGHERRRGSGTAAWKKATAGAWPACSGRSGSPGWPTATGASRTCTRPTPGRSCPATRTRWGCGPWRPSTWPAAGIGQAQEVIEARTGVTVGRAQLAGLAEDLAAWTDDFYEERSRDAEEEEQPDSDVIMMQADGKGIAMRPEHRKNAGKEDGTRPGIKKMAEIVAVADFTPAVREPEDIAAPPARRKAHPGPDARDKWVSASITDGIADMIGDRVRRG